jgi:hypothetical protein
MRGDFTLFEAIFRNGAGKQRKSDENTGYFYLPFRAFGSKISEL